MGIAVEGLRFGRQLGCGGYWSRLGRSQHKPAAERRGVPHLVLERGRI